VDAPEPHWAWLASSVKGSGVIMGHIAWMPVRCRRNAFIANATLKSDSGQIMKARFHFQFFYDGEEITKVLVDDWTTWCVGKPD
jgi:hypothetical protein